jgi:hypothetical protein
MAGGEWSVKTDGLRSLRRDLRKLGDDLTDLKDANARTASIVANAAASRAPRRTGRLAASVRGNRAVGSAVVRAGGAAVPYAGPVHWGWPAHNIAAQPFISSAAVDTQPVWLPAHAADVAKAVDKLAGRTYS